MELDSKAIETLSVKCSERMASSPQIFLISYIAENDEYLIGRMVLYICIGIESKKKSDFRR